MVTDFEQIAQYLYVRDGSGWQHDELMDDLSLGITTPEGLVVVLGCAHRGIINSIYRLQEVSGVKEVNTVIGGCHLFGASKECIQRTIAVLQELKVQRLGVSHCTGMPAACAMAQTFGERFFFNNAGSVTEIPAPPED
jgi:7,8-dihydropterin-6-yl-methyl-4-(beta-D-ribofuranosyl)aminobenzene 5'-phosphate synthase